MKFLINNITQKKIKKRRHSIKIKRIKRIKEYIKIIIRYIKLKIIKRVKIKKHKYIIKKLHVISVNIIKN